MEGCFLEERRDDGFHTDATGKDAFFHQDFAYFSTRTSLFDKKNTRGRKRKGRRRTFVNIS